MRALFFIVVVVLFCSTLIYLRARLAHMLSKFWATLICLFFLIVVISFPIRVATGIRFGVFDEPYMYVVFITMGLYSLIMVFSLVGHIAAAILSRTSVKQEVRKERRAFLNKSFQSGATVATALTGGAAFINARRGPRVIEVTVPVEGLHKDLEGFRIAQLSDVHVGPTIRAPFIEPIVDITNGLKADLIALTGDLVDGNVKELTKHVAPFKKLKATHGVFFCTGNHEYYSGAKAWCKHFASMGINVLLNEHKVITHESAKMLVGGVTDLRAHTVLPEHRTNPKAVLENQSANDFKLLLAHQPKSALKSAPLGFDLQLSGHTHGGQFFPFNYVIHAVQPFVAGLYKHKKMWVYVNRGTTYWGPPFRLGPPSEITLITLKRA